MTDMGEYYMNRTSVMKGLLQEENNNILVLVVYNTYITVDTLVKSNMSVS